MLFILRTLSLFFFIDLLCLFRNPETVEPVYAVSTNAKVIIGKIFLLYIIVRNMSKSTYSFCCFKKDPLKVEF